MKKICPWCGKEMVRRIDETAGNFKKKIHCSQKCAAMHREAKRRTK